MGSHIEITHRTTLKRDFEWLFDGKFIEPGRDLLGYYLLEFEDGLAITVPVIYGNNISDGDKRWDLRVSDIFDRYELDMSLLEVSYTTLPVRQGLQTSYRFVLENPFPDKKLVRIEFIAKEGFSESVILEKVEIKSGS